MEARFGRKDTSLERRSDSGSQNSGFNSLLIDEMKIKIAAGSKLPGEREYLAGTELLSGFIQCRAGWARARFSYFMFGWLHMCI